MKRYSAIRSRVSKLVRDRPAKPELSTVERRCGIRPNPMVGFISMPYLTALQSARWVRSAHLACMHANGLRLTEALPSRA